MNAYPVTFAEPAYLSPAERLEAALADIGPLRAADSQPAGSHGHIEAREGRLFFADGTPARFWGVGLTFSAGVPVTFPPPKKEAEALARRIASFGFNLVRFVGIDNSLRPLCRYWQEHGEFGGPLMDRLDYFVAILARHGIYHAFSINNSSLCALDDLGSRTNRHPQPWRRYAGIRLVYPAMRWRQGEWVAAFFSHRNPYTKQTYAADPANVYFTSVNEDSLWRVYFDGGKYLEVADREWFDTDFRNWLVHRGNRARQETNRLSEHPREHGVFGLWTPRELLSSWQKALIYEYLVMADSRLVQEVRRRLKGLGFRGLITATNNWYGYGALDVVRRSGDFVEIHGYFDHPRGNGDNSRITGKSFLFGAQDTVAMARLLDRDWSFPLAKAARSALTGLPLIVGEWNHAAWSPYAYEGPVLMFGYAARQGYDGLVAHTWFPYPASRTGADVMPDAFGISTNPVLLRLSPVLSEAWRRGCFGPAEERAEVTVAKSTEDLAERTFEVGLGPDPRIHFEDGFDRSLRVRLLPPDGSEPAAGGESVAGASSPRAPSNRPGNLALRISPRSGETILDGKCIVGAAFSGKGGGFTALQGGVSAELDAPGAIALVSLDGRRVGSSGDILVAVVGSPHLEGVPSGSHPLPFRLPRGVGVESGGVSGSLTLAPGRGCPAVEARDAASQAGLSANRSRGGCVIRFRSGSGAWLRIHAGHAAISAQ